MTTLRNVLNHTFGVNFLFYIFHIVSYIPELYLVFLNEVISILKKSYSVEIIRKLYY